MDKRYEHIQIIEEQMGLPSKIKIKYNNGEELEVGQNSSSIEILNHFTQFAKQLEIEGYAIPRDSAGIIDLRKFIDEETSKSNGKITRNLTNINAVNVASTAEIETHTSTEAQETTEEKDNKRNLKIRVLALLTALGIGVGGYVLGNVSRNSANQKPTGPIVIVDSSKDPVTNNFTNRLDQIASNQQQIGEQLVDVVSGRVTSYDELDEALSNEMALSFANMDNISNYINGKKLTGNVYYANFRNVYIYDNIDYYAVDRFNILRDNILASAYNEQNKTATKESIKAFYKNFVDFVYNGQKLYCRPLDMEYTFADLSPSAQHTILSMGLGVLTVEYNFNATIDGKKCDRVSIGTKTEELRQQVYETLSQNQKIRR